MFNVYLKKVIVTGHTGFLGSHVSDYLEQRKYQIIGISRKKDPRFDFKQFGKDVNRVGKLVISGKIFGIVHCAGITDIEYCKNNPSRCFDVNLAGTIKMLEVARQKKCKFVYLSTSHVYGKPQKNPIKETHRINPISVYGASKHAAEICCKSYAKQYGLDVTILRPFSVYGPREARHFVISSIISQLRHNNIIKIGNLYPRRDFIHVSDVTNAIELALRKSNGFNVFNVGSGRAVSINHVCKTLLKISGKESPIKTVKSLSRKQDIEKMVADYSSLKKLGWKPKILLSDGLKETFLSDG